MDFINAFKYFKGNNKGQLMAIDYLASLLSQEEINEFARLYRSTPEQKLNSAVKNEWTLNIKLLSQRDNKGNIDGDKRLDMYQTCNVTSCAMAINYYYPNANIKPTNLDKQMKALGMSRYSHANLAMLLGKHGVKSVFSTTTKLADIVNNIKAGNPVIWSNKLTDGGHIVILGGWSDTKQAFYVFDPYGEWFSTGYKDIRKPYWLSLRTLQAKGANGPNASGHWAHLLTRD